MSGIATGSPLTPAWLASQRWFRAKRRVVTGVEVVDRAQLPGAGGSAALSVIEVAYADAGTDRYLVPMVGEDEPRDGDGTWRGLVRLMAEGAQLRGATGRFTFEATPALESLLPSPVESASALDERRLGVEQSNTSVVLGERLILKLFRLLEAGESPDLEVSAFLSEIGFPHAAAVAGSAHYHPDAGEPAVAAMLQAFVPSRGDAWAHMLRCLATDPAAGVDAARTVGRVTAELHRALASRPGSAKFPVHRVTSEEVAKWRGLAERELALALASVSGEIGERVTALVPAVRARFDAAFAAATGAATVSRIHGDYHLGQLLAATDGGFVIIDFEGEPARPLTERRAVTSPLRDVAGMLRSLDYAVRTATRPNGAELDAERWLRGARAAFVSGYGGTTPTERALVAAFELEKACYEVRYESNNRPDWLWLPVAALERLAAT